MRLRGARAAWSVTSCTEDEDEKVGPSIYTRDLFPTMTATVTITTNATSNGKTAYKSNSIPTSHRFIPSHLPQLGTLGPGDILMPPLPQPIPHVLDPMAPMRPVSDAVGVVVDTAVNGGLRLRTGGGGGDREERQEEERGSVFGRFWS